MPSKFDSIPGAAREAGIYAVAFGISRVTGILLLPLLTRRLSDSELGVYGLLTSGLLLLQYLSGLGLDSGATRWFYDAEAQGLEGQLLTTDRRRTLSTWVWLTMFVSVALAVIGVVFSGPIAHAAFEGSSREIGAVRAASLSIPALAMINVLQHWYRMVRRPLPALVISSVVALTTMALTLALVAWRDFGVVGVFAAQAVVGAGTTLVGFWQMWSVIGPPNLDRQRLGDMLRYSLPLLPAIASPLLLGLLTRVLIRVFSSVEQVGEFQVVSMLATVVVLFTTAIQQAWEPYALSHTDREGAKPIYRTVLLGYTVCAGVITLVLAGVFPLALPVLGAGFVHLAFPAVLFSASVLISGAFPIVNTGPSIVGTGRPALEAMVAGSVLNLLLCVVLVPSLGQRGACWAAAATSVFVIGFGIVRSERAWHVGYQAKGMGSSAVAAAAASSAVFFVASRSTVSVVARSAAVGVLLVVCGGVATVVLQRLLRKLRSPVA